MSRRVAAAVSVRDGQAKAPVALGRRVRQLRGTTGQSVRAFADATGFSASFISQLENGDVSPSLGSLEKIAEALGVALRDLFVDAEEPSTLIVRRNERPHTESSWSRARIEALGIAGQRLAAMLITLDPEGRSGKRPRAHPKEEFAFVLDGDVRLTLGEDEHDLRKGDSAILPAGVPRLWVNAASREARVVIVSAL
jgi:transcriptional regulator with XRE-family HTH domain